MDSRLCRNGFAANEDRLSNRGADLQEGIGMMPYSRVDRYHSQVQTEKQEHTMAVSRRQLFAAGCALAPCAIFFLPEGLAYEGKIALLVFLLSMAMWIGTTLPAGYVAICALAATILLKGAEPELLYQSLSAEVVWLMVGSYVLGEGVKQSGLAGRMSAGVLRRAQNPDKLFFWTMLALQPLAFFIPSTSGRAALTLPIVKNLSGRVEEKNQKQALAVLVPSVILMTTSASLIGAGSHLIGLQLLKEATGEGISYLKWLLWGAPFALAMSMIAFAVIKGYFPKGESQSWKAFKEPACVQADSPAPYSQSEKKALYIIGGLVILWLSESIHGFDIAFITMLGAAALMAPGVEIVSWKDGLKSVSWNLILFVAAASALGTNLVRTGAVDWVSGKLFQSLELIGNFSEWLVLMVILLVAITSHLYITSHTTRAVVMVPSLLLLSEALGMDAGTVVFLSLVGMNYCLTFPVSSKALLVYFEEEEINYQAGDLLKLSLILMPIYLFVMILFYFTYWRWTGMGLWI
ncbi:SLC13 family permease [Mesobacillus foraminis]|uniref:SLC13 family permease n=1 Tax=Mesobacillus foraminis TaxID=279826 RepID=UPI000EF54EA4|nr:SLC13 family permease [Mesobacillus foraminis]